MSANEDPDSSSEPVAPDGPNDDLEHWLSDLRTEVSADPSGWINKDPAGEQRNDQPVERRPPPPARPGADAGKPSGGGRHRAPD
jgi:hypothetical protein